MIFKVKLIHPDAVLPAYSKPGDAGMDLTATEIVRDTQDAIWYSCGINIEIPPGHMGLIFPRSSVSKIDLQLANSVGVIDSGYRGDVQVRFNKIHRVESYNAELDDNPYSGPRVYEKGERIAQLVIVPFVRVYPQVAEELSESERGEGGFGSTGTT